MKFDRQKLLKQLQIPRLAPLLFVLLSIGGCTTKSNAHARSQAAFFAGQQQALSQQNAPTVVFRGDIKNPRVPWVEDLSLAKALIAAEYTGLWDPHTIVIIRKGETYKIDPKRLLRGLEDPPLEPGDIVEIHH
jgi:hypothetical protein